MKQMVVKCRKTIRFNHEERFIERKTYFGQKVYDLMFLKAENGVIVEFIDFQNDNWFQEHFDILKTNSNIRLIS